jgi:putative transposase
MECVLGVPFGYEPNDELRKLLEDFKDMVNFCIDYAYRRRITSYAKLRKGVYEEWKRRWSYSTHFCHSACKIALAMLKTYRRKRRLRMRGLHPLTPKATYEPLTVRLKG